MPKKTGTAQRSASKLATSPYSSLHPCGWFLWHWLLFHETHLANLPCFHNFFLRIRTKFRPPISIWFLETWECFLALSLELTRVCVRNKQLMTSHLCQIACKRRVLHPDIITTFGGLVFFTEYISFYRGYHRTSTNMAHNISILNFRQEIWGLQHEKATCRKQEAHTKLRVYSPESVA